MKPLNTYEIAETVKGEIICGGCVSVTSVCQDSRRGEKGALFVAIKGDAFDGHDFIKMAACKGCVAVIADDEQKAKKAALSASELCVIKVENSEKALQKLAKAYITGLDIKKAAVTGSTGKTTTRDMLYYVLNEKYNTAKNEGNFNSTVGVPLTVMTFDENTEAAVIEMGMDTAGEIAISADVVEPDIAVITNVGVSHLERLGSREAIFNAKMEITNAFNEDNTLIISEDEEFLNRDKIKGKFKLITVGEGENCDFRISDIKIRNDGNVSFTLEHENESVKVDLPVLGKHNAFNAGLAIAAGKCFGVDMESAAAGLSKMELTGKRLSVKRGNSITVIDDTYNASPDSMKAALDILAEMEGERRIAVLGDMYELGENEKEFHENIGKLAAEKADKVYSVGNLAKYISEENHFDTVEELIADIDNIFKAGDVVLVKASRGMALERIVENILK